MNNQNNITGETNKPRLKKVKKPIRRIQPQVPNDAYSMKEKKDPANMGRNDVNTNPFQQQAVSSKTKTGSYSIDGAIENSQLPAISKNKQTDYVPQFISDEAEYSGANNTNRLSDESKKIIIIAAVAAFFLGFIIAKMMGGEQKIVHNGLQEVVINAEVPQGRPRCGQAPAGQGCVLYIMNPQRQELSARDFYDLAAQLTGRQRFVIETGNMRYSNIKIAPGKIGQFNIPPLTQ